MNKPQAFTVTLPPTPIAWTKADVEHAFRVAFGHILEGKPVEVESSVKELELLSTLEDIVENIDGWSGNTKGLLEQIRYSARLAIRSF